VFWLPKPALEVISIPPAFFALLEKSFVMLKSFLLNPAAFAVPPPKP